MLEKNVSWTQIKNFVNLKQCSIQIVEDANQYELYALDGNFCLSCKLQKTSPAGSDQVDFETNYKPKGNKSLSTQNLPFAAKVLPNGKKLYTRVHGIEASVSGSPDTIDFTIPYTACKLTGLEIINGSPGDKVNLKILDNDTGTYSGVPNYMLNQFGFDVYVAKDFYVRESAYDADLFVGMKVRLEYDSAATLPVNIYVNFIIHEVKD